MYLCVCVTVFGPEQASVALIFDRKESSALVLLGNPAESVLILVLLICFESLKIIMNLDSGELKLDFLVSALAQSAWDLLTAGK